MKKTSLLCILDLIDGHPVDTAGLKAEIEAELIKGQAKAESNRALYAEIHDKVMEALSSATNPVTAQELADETGCAKGKIVYGLRNYWADEVTKIEGKVSTYTLKA